MNTYNVVWMLFKEYMERNKRLTNVTEEEIQLKNRIIEILEEYECERHIDVNDESIDNAYLSWNEASQNSDESEFSSTLSCDELKHTNIKPVSLDYKKKRRKFLA